MCDLFGGLGAIFLGAIGRAVIESWSVFPGGGLDSYFV